MILGVRGSSSAKNRIDYRNRVAFSFVVVILRIGGDDTTGATGAKRPMREKLEEADRSCIPL
jgi:hypothetical protein